MEQEKGMGPEERRPQPLSLQLLRVPLENFISDSWGVRISDSGKAFGGPQGQGHCIFCLGQETHV